MRKLMILALVFSLSGGMVAGCGGKDTTNTTTEEVTYLKDVIKDELSAKIAFYKAVSTNRFDDLEHIAEMVSWYIGNGTEDINGEVYGYEYIDGNYTEEVCGNYTVDTDTQTFTFNFDNCSDWGFTGISGQLSGSYETDNESITSIKFTLSDGFSFMYDYIDTFYGTTASFEYAYYDDGTYENVYTITADKIEYRYIPEDNETVILPCFNETDIAATLTDVKATIKESNNGTISTWSQDSSYKVEWPPFIDAPVMMDYKESWSWHETTNTETYYLKIADGTIVVDNFNCSDDNCTFDLKYNGSVIYSGTFENFEDELNADLNQDGVCETLTVYP